MGLSWLPIYGAESQWQVEGPAGFQAEGKAFPITVDLPAPVTVELRLSFPASYKVDSTALTNNLLRNPTPGPAPFALLKSESKLLPAAEGRIVQLWHFQLEPLIPGEHTLTLFGIPFIPKASTKDQKVSLLSGLITINVTLPVIDDKLQDFEAGLLGLNGTYPVELNSELRSQFNDNFLQNAPKNNVNRSNEKRFPWEPLAIIAALGAIAALFVYKKVKKEQSKKPISASERHFQMASSALEKIQKQDQPDYKLAETFVNELSDAVRANFEERYGINIEALTTEEFLHKLPSLATITPKEEELLTKFLNKADKVKFASHTPTLEECIQAENSAKELLNVG
jgi:hypothetical protein